ncbi:hypothetical protein A2U01_0113040, partial [Trifolium medium]|nr:hypothetical protein [Trifolium medium]
WRGAQKTEPERALQAKLARCAGSWARRAPACKGQNLQNHAFELAMAP